jgi:integrase
MSTGVVDQTAPAADDRALAVLRRGATLAADAGYYVFPVKPGQKVPAVEQWEQAATRDPQRLARWWRGVAYNPLTGLTRDPPSKSDTDPSLIARTSSSSVRGGQVNVRGDHRQDGEDVVLPSWGRVVEIGGVAGAWRVIDPDGRVVEPVAQFLRDFAARGNRPGSVRSYAYALLRWWRWLQVVNVAWDRATATEAREFVLWLTRAEKSCRSPRTVSAPTAGTVNAVTGKRYLGDGFEPRTVRHGNAVLRSFYEYWIELGGGPLVNPMPLAGRAGRANAHHDPLQPYRGDGRLRYNPKIAKRRPRAIPDERWNELFAALGSHRDRAIAALAVSNGARAGELLGVRGVDLDWGEQLVQVTRKGSGLQQWLPASPEAFVWLRLYLAELDPLRPNDPIWWTRRRRDHGDGLRRHPLNYEALRAVFRRVNLLLGTNYSMHDLRHTAALRMSRDEQLSMRDVQTILGHAHLSTTADVYLVEDDAQVLGRVHQHLAEREHRARTAAASSATPVAAGYAAADLSVLFGTGR